MALSLTYHPLLYIKHNGTEQFGKLPALTVCLCWANCNATIWCHCCSQSYHYNKWYDSYDDYCDIPMRASMFLHN